MDRRKCEDLKEFGHIIESLMSEVIVNPILRLNNEEKNIYFDFQDLGGEFLYLSGRTRTFWRIMGSTAVIKSLHV